MATITEDYVSFETAKLLKEKTFNEECFALYDPDGILIQSGIRLNNIQVGRVKGSYSAPTLQKAMKWLRMEHNILLFLLPAQENGKLVYLVEVWTWNEEEGIYESTYAPIPRKKPEEAVEAAIKYSLEHLI